MKKISFVAMPVTLNLSRKGPSVGSWLGIGGADIAEIMARAGFEWLVVDMEHSAIDLSQAKETIRVVNLCGLPALVRVESNNIVAIKKAMDMGASGVIVPMVNSAKEARDAVAAVKYPPCASASAYNCCRFSCGSRLNTKSL